MSTAGRNRRDEAEFASFVCVPAVSSEELPAETKLLSISLPFTPLRA